MRSVSLCSDHVKEEEKEKVQEQIELFSGKKTFLVMAEPDSACQKPTQEAPGQSNLSKPHLKYAGSCGGGGGSVAGLVHKTEP